MYISIYIYTQLYIYIYRHLYRRTDTHGAPSWPGPAAADAIETAVCLRSTATLIQYRRLK